MSDEPAANPRAFVDSNIWLYAFIEGDDPTKTAIAKSIVAGSQIVTSTQVINEVSRNLLRKARFTEERIRSVGATNGGRNLKGPSWPPSSWLGGPQSGAEATALQTLPRQTRRLVPRGAFGVRSL